MSKPRKTPHRNPYKLSRNPIGESSWRRIDIDWEGNQPTPIHADLVAYDRWLAAMACIGSLPPSVSFSSDGASRNRP
jgi:hypothetical protein